ncbi:MAG: hypothetical protein Q8P41_15070 [Pseudomonadota bacterium]|nr:hypothetical protein [Pseudomonadota bacterium]
MTLEGRPREVAGLLLALVLSVAAAIAITWPMVQYLDVIVLGGGELGGWLWRYDWHFRSLEGISEAGLGPLELWRDFVSLGRHPETGNILDVLALSYPLDRFFGFPASYNLKILILLSGNGLCAYALGRYFSGSVSAALGACALAVVNPLCLLEVQASGLRQALLWWVLLYPPLLDRALRRRSLASGVVAGLCFGVAGAFYWFYGLFTAIFSVVWFLKHVVVERARLDWRGMMRAVAGVVIGTALAAGPFILPYAMPEGGGPTGGGGGAAALPEMTFFLPFPAYDTISHAPMRPQTYAENVHASINRTIGSSWSASYPFDPTLNESLPLVVIGIGVLPAILRRRSWGWLAVWLFFYVGTLGPFLRVGAGDNTNVTQLFDHYVLRLPYTWMFQFIPGMSRMFAPYRLASFVMVSSVALVAIGLSRIPGRSYVWPLVFAATVMQPMYRFGRGAVNEGDADSREFRSPIKANRIRIPDAYKALDPTELGGIVELPLDQQQDLVCYYQLVHRQKVYRSWASPSAVPPTLRPQGAGGLIGERLRFWARADVVSGPVPDVWQLVSRDPENTDLTVLGTDALTTWAKTGAYNRVIVHERGYFLVDPTRGTTLYLAAVRRLGAALGVTPVESVELAKGDPANPEFGVPIVGDLVPWTSQPAELTPERAPARFRMAILDLSTAAAPPAPTASPAPPPDPGPVPLDSAPIDVD